MAETEKKFRAAITATARFLPDKVVTNADMEKLVDTSDEWIRTRTGIVERRFLEEHEPTSKMAIAVGADLLRKRGLSGDDIDLIIVATITPDMVFPATACLVQHGIGANRAWAYDLSAACSGFVYAITAGAQFIETGAHRRVMVIGADKMSMLLDFTDRTTCVLFGDGAGGVILERGEDGAAEGEAGAGGPHPASRRLGLPAPGRGAGDRGVPARLPPGCRDPGRGEDGEKGRPNRSIPWGRAPGAPLGARGVDEGPTHARTLVALVAARLPAPPRDGARGTGGFPQGSPLGAVLLLRLSAFPADRTTRLLQHVPA